MKIIKLSDYNTDAVTIWHSTDVGIWRELSFWYADMQSLTIIPAKLMGLVCIAPRRVAYGNRRILRGVVMIRPCGLSITWPTEMDVTLSEMSSLKMQAWAQNTKPWTTLRPRPR
jgi:hypothetical protein